MTKIADMSPILAEALRALSEQELPVQKASKAKMRKAAKMPPETFRKPTKKRRRLALTHDLMTGTCDSDGRPASVRPVTNRPQITINTSSNGEL